jgi:hypothetical protein
MQRIVKFGLMLLELDINYFCSRLCTYNIINKFLLYFPKQEGGLGLKRIEKWNTAAVLKHIWHLFTQAGSLWVAWVMGA